MSTRNPKLGERLTVQESKVCEMMARGMTTKEIARAMQPPISPRTVETHRQRAKTKKGARNAADLARLVISEQFAKGGTS